MDIIKKNHKIEIKKIENLEKINNNFESLFSCFFASWRIFAAKLENINLIIKSKSNVESKLAPKFTQIFEILSDMSQVPKKIRDEPHLEFHKSIKNKMD